MRRQQVPAVAMLQVSSIGARLDGLLRPHVPVPVFDRKLQPLAGVRWPRGAGRVEVPGEVALFEVVDPGELQEWKTEMPRLECEKEPGRGIQPKGRNHG